jgi:hypothetical protein
MISTLENQTIFYHSELLLAITINVNDASFDVI